MTQQRKQQLKLKLEGLKTGLAADASRVKLPSSNDLVVEFGISYPCVRAMIASVWHPDKPPKFPRTATTRVRDHQLKRLSNDATQDKNRLFLILDQFSAHMTPDVLNEAEKLNIELVYVPAGMTGDLQPLDVGINSVLKAKQSKMYRQALLQDQQAPYKPEHALRDLCAISQDLGPSLIRKSWDQAQTSATARVQEQELRAAQPKPDPSQIASHFEDVDNHHD